MFAPSARSVVIAAAAAALTGTAAFGQQLANLDDARRAYVAERCGHIRDANLQLGCEAQKHIEFDRAQTAVAKQVTAEASKSIASEQQLQRCIAFLGQKRESGTVFDRKITRENVCPYARELGMRDGPG